MDRYHRPEDVPLLWRARSLDGIRTQNQGFSAGKAALGAVALGPLGLAAGALGKRKHVYYCGNCGYSASYDNDMYLNH